MYGLCLFGSAVSTQSDRLSVASANVSRHVSTPSNSTPAAAAAASSASPQSLHTSSEQHDSFDDFDEDVTDSSPMQPIGTCVALYPFDGTLHRISQSDSQLLYLLCKTERSTNERKVFQL